MSNDYCAFQLHVDSKIQSSTYKCVFRYRQSNVRRFLPASDDCRARSNQIKWLNTVQTTSSEAGMGGAAEHLIDGSEKRLSFEF